MFSIEIITNIFIPLVSSFFLFIYFLYFVFVQQDKTSTTLFFKIYLISFSIYLIGRPIQLLSGPHPLPLIITCIRSYIFYAISIPFIILSDFSNRSKSKKNKMLLLISNGVVMATIYSVFHTLGTSSSFVLFRLGPITAFDSFTPNMTPPFYGREVTNTVYIYMALLLLFDSIRKLKNADNSKVVLYNIGKLIYAITLLIGQFLQQWWIYYAASIVSVMFLGYGITKDINENKTRMESVIRYIKENLIQEISLSADIQKHVTDMLSLLNIPKDINTFIALKESAVINASHRNSPYIDDSQINEISSLLTKKVGKNQFILIPMGGDMLGICLSIPNNSRSPRLITTEICEYLKKSLEFITLYDFGIGRSYTSLDDLKKSYKEAVYAVEYANSLVGGQVIHIEDLQYSSVRREYPLIEKNEFLSAIRLGDLNKAMEKLESLNDMLHWYFNEGGRLLKIRIYELIGGIIEAGMAGGGDVDKLLELSDRLYAESVIINSHLQLNDWLKSRTEEVIDIIKKSHCDRSHTIVKKALQYIDEHFAESISVADVANAVCISESYLKSLFKKCSDQSYSEYLTDVRINHAKILLRSTDKSITEIATEVGYQTANSFSNIFKKKTGLTPSIYKKDENFVL